MDNDKTIIENQLRIHHKNTLLNYFRRWMLLRKVGSHGSNIIVGKNVTILRFPEKVFLGNNVVLKEGARLCPTNSSAKIHIGDNTTVGYHTMVFSSLNITIHEDCLIAPFCYFVDANHQIGKKMNINQQPLETRKIIIERDVWLGVGCKILPGVTVGEGSVVGAGSVVNRNVEPFSIVGGIPAKIIGKR